MQTKGIEAAGDEVPSQTSGSKQIEIELRERHRQYESLVHSIDGIVWEVDAETFRFTFVSKKAERILGYRLDKWLEPNFWTDHLHPDDREAALTFCLDATRRRVDHQFEYRMIAADGREVWLRDHVTVSVSVDQSVRLSGVMFDITERKHAEALLQAKEREFRAIVENAPDQIIRYDRKFRRTYVNPAVARLYGLPAKALIGKPIGSVVRDAGLDLNRDQIAQMRERIATVFETGRSIEFEVVWPSPSGPRHYSSRFFPEFDAGGSVSNVLGIARDITERKQADAALRTQKEMLQTIVDHIPVMINFTDSAGRINLVNREWERTIGWSLEDIRKEDIDVFLECYPDPEYRQEVMQFVRKGKGEWKDFRTRTRDGGVIDTSWARVSLSDGTTIGIGQDVTERKRAEEASRKSEDRLRLVTDTIPTMAWSLLADGTIDFVNGRWMGSF